MRRLILPIALSLLVGGWQQAHAQHPCMCYIRQYDTNPDSGMPIYLVKYHAENCQDYEEIFIEDAPDIPEQQCPDDCNPAIVRLKAAAASDQQHVDALGNLFVLKKKPAKPKQKKEKDFVPKGKGIDATGTGIVRFSLQGQQEPCYVKLFLVQNSDIAETKKVENSGLFHVGFEIKPVPNNEVDFKFNCEDSLQRVRPLKLKHPEEETIIVPQQYIVKVGTIEYTVVATR
jgi:hypothetical protein